MATNKYDVELLKAHQQGEYIKLFGKLFSLVSVLIFSYAATVAVFQGLKEIAQVANAEQISALSKIIEMFKLADIVHYVVDLALGLAYYVQRRNCKKAIEEKAKLEDQLQGGEPNRTSSNLTPTGETP